MNEKIYQGTDKTISLPVYDENQNQIDLTDLVTAEIVNIVAFLNSNYDVQDSFVLNKTGQYENGFYPLTIVDNKVVLKLGRNQTQNYKTGTLNIEIVLVKTDATAYEGFTHTNYPQNKIGCILPSEARRIA
ncbi:hypothetical protein V9L05_20545 [Bernardetia sp. Wsw4-3y2]|uniref:hypothetical protein n=1 Tax=Bernardetia sp. Wsw4-3y2 TaxID=3127471 RepID=UPI0030D16905